MTPYQFQVWKRKIAKEEKRRAESLRLMREGISKFYNKVI